MKYKIISTKPSVEELIALIPKDIPIILCSGATLQMLKRNGVDLTGMQISFVQKPFSTDDVAKITDDVYPEKNATIYYLENDKTVAHMLEQIFDAKHQHISIKHFLSPESFFNYLTENKILPNPLLLTDNDMGSNLTGGELIIMIRRFGK